MVALGFHQVMSTFGIEGMITGGLETSWYCTWSISGIQVFILVLCHELGQWKGVAKVGGMDEDVIFIFTDMSVLMVEIVRWGINFLVE